MPETWHPGEISRVQLKDPVFSPPGAKEEQLKQVRTFPVTVRSVEDGVQMERSDYQPNTNQGGSRMNPKTTWSGILGAVAQGVKLFWPEGSMIADAVTALAVALIGYFATDAK
jgi:hypothetical protein